ncbi:MAG: peptidoglycan DD-metalloendopeptidase family protein, partial [Chloroflexi bacterium]|nr:peptidoglycan DD-metalloendopeptidase family protein [Chloroflexota bacterium]
QPAAAPTVPTATAIAKTGANVRAAPVSGNIVQRVEFGTQMTVIGGQAQGSGTNYVWAQVRLPGGATGFIRHSFVKITGSAAQWGLSAGDEYPAPMRNYWWVRGFGIGFPANDANEVQHNGWDLGANTGEPMLAGPNGGVVTQTMLCTKCTPDRPSTLMQGLSLGDQSVFNDPGWGFGYGNFVVIRYDHTLLPASTQQRLAQRSLPGAHIFVLYGHLASFNVGVGQPLSAHQQFAQCGNTGNSEAAHLHLEVRAGANPNAQWAQLRSGLLDPGVLFSR